MTQMKNTFRRFRRGDLQAFWKDLRPEDLRELSVLNMTDPVMIEDLVTAMGQKLFVWVTERGPVAVFGVSPSGDPDVGHIWALASREAQRRWRFISRHAPSLLNKLGQGYRILSNVKDARNTIQIAWLSRLGFTFISTDEDFGGSGLPFHTFVRIVQ